MESDVASTILRDSIMQEDNFQERKRDDENNYINQRFNLASFDQSEFETLEPQVVEDLNSMIKSSLGGEEFAGENKGSSLQDIIASFNAAVINNMIKETEVSELEDESIPTLGDCI